MQAETCKGCSLRWHDAGTYTESRGCGLIAPAEVFFVVHLYPSAGDIGDATSNKCYRDGDTPEFLRFITGKNKESIQMSGANEDVETSPGTAARPQPLLRGRLQHSIAQQR